MFEKGDTIFNLITLKKGYITDVRSDGFFKRTTEGENIRDYQHSYKATCLNKDSGMIDKEFDLGSRWFPEPLFMSSSNLLIEKSKQ